MNKNDKRFNKKSFTSWILTGLLLIAFVYLFWFYRAADQEVILKHSEFVSLLESGNVKSVSIDGQTVSGEFKIPFNEKKYFKSDIMPRDGLWEKIERAGVTMEVNPQDSGSFALSFIAGLLVLILGIGLFYLVIFFRNANGGGGGGSGKIFNVGKSKARFYPQGSVGVKFSDVAGANEVKEELADVVEFLKNPEKFERLGARIPRGVLLSGDPGNGKTLLAKAVAGEANCPFFSISGSDFVEVFVGVGASRVRDLFYQARKHSPCILFIDEIDSVGRQRGVGMGGGNDEREQTLNQLLAEMDGFETEAGEVIVLAATNRVDVLDSALMRPGRFDRVVYIPFPDLQARLQILKIHSKKVKLAASADLEKLAKVTRTFSGADLANLINEAALSASKTGLNEITNEDLENARDKIAMGSRNKSMIRTEQELKETAYHEAGHALVRLLLPECHPLHKLTIASRGSALGLTWFMPEEENNISKASRYKAEAMSGLGGMVAEKLFFGEHGSGVSSDLEKVSSIIRTMVCRFGMSDMGAGVFDTSADVHRQGKQQYSQKTLERIDAEVERIIAECYEKTMQLFVANKDMLEKLALTLLEKETLDASEAYALLGLEPRAELIDLKNSASSKQDA